MGKVAENQQLKDQKLAKLTWKIENFTSLYTSKLYSEIFEVTRYRWRLLVYPKGNGVNYLSVYLDVPDSHSLPYGWSRTAKFRISLINHKDSKKTIEKVRLSESSVPIDSSVSKPVDLDDMEFIYVKAISLLKWTSKALTSSEFSGTGAVPHFQKDAIYAKERLILSPLDDLVDPKHETAMTETLSILGDDLSLFCDEQAKQIMRLRDIFPTLYWTGKTRFKLRSVASISCLLSRRQKIARRFSQNRRGNKD